MRDILDISYLWCELQTCDPHPGREAIYYRALTLHKDVSTLMDPTDAHVLTWGIAGCDTLFKGRGLRGPKKGGEGPAGWSSCPPRVVTDVYHIASGVCRMDTFNSSSRAIGDISTHFCAGVGPSRLVYSFAKIDGWAEMNVFFQTFKHYQ